MKRGRKAKSPPKPKKVAYRLIEENDFRYAGISKIVRETVHAHHRHLGDAKIALAWHAGYKPDTDGHVVLGKFKRASDLDRQLVDYDFILILNREFWTGPTTTDEQRRALVDHELCHGQVKNGPDGEPLEDELGKVIYRTRKHDVEEFAEIVERHGIYKRDLELFFQAARRAPSLPFKDKAEEKPTPKRRGPKPVAAEADAAPGTH